MRTQTWCFALSFAAAGCTTIVGNKLDDKPSSISDIDGGQGDGDAGSNLPGDGDGDIYNGDAGGDGDGMVPGDGDGLGINPDGGLAYTRADIKICLGASHGCSLFPNGNIRCWGANDEMQASLPGGTYRDLACGDHHTCAVSSAGTVTCVGRNRDGQRIAPTESNFKAVMAGDAHSCALRNDDSVVCWGNDADTHATPPVGVTFSALAGGGNFSCGIRKSDAKLQCWGSSSANRLKPPMDLTFKALDLGPNYGCGITTEGVVRCWGHADFTAPELDNVRAISMGTYHACAVKNDGSGRCWPPSPLPLVGTYVGVTSGASGHLFTPESGEPESVASESFFPTPPALFYESP